MIIDHLFESAAPGPSLEQLATISDQALDDAYHYGRSSPGNTFGWQANLKSAAYAKRMIDAGQTDIDRIADAIHQGWNVTARAFVANPDQFDDTAKLRAAGKLEAKLEQRAKLMKIGYAQLPDEEQEKDRVVARALLQALRAKPGVAEAPGSSPSRRRRALDTAAAQERGEPTPDQLDAKLYQDWYQKLQQKKPAPEPGVAEGSKPTKKEYLKKLDQNRKDMEDTRKQGTYGAPGSLKNVDWVKKQGVAEGSVVSINDNPATIKRLAKQWWTGNEQQHTQAQRMLNKMGWDIYEDEDDIILSKDEQEYAIPMDELEGLVEGVAEAMLKTSDRPVKYIMKNGQRIGEVGIDTTYDHKVFYGKRYDGSRDTSGHESIKDALSDLLDDRDWDQRRDRPAPHITVMSANTTPGMAEATGDVKFDKMLKGITAKKAVAKQRKADTQQQARDAFGGMFGGGNPADKLGVGKKDVAEGRFEEPLTGWHIVSRAHDQVVRGTPSFVTRDQAQKYLMTRMFANHQDFKVVHTAGVAEGPVTKKPQPYNDPNWIQKLSKQQLDALAGKKPKKDNTKPDVSEGFGPLPRGDMLIKVDGRPVQLTRVGKDKNYIGFAWLASNGQERYEEAAVGDLGDYSDLIRTIRSEIQYTERQLARAARQDLDLQEVSEQIQQAHDRDSDMTSLVMYMRRRWGTEADPGQRLMEASMLLPENLRKWFKDKWVRFNPQGKIMGACARGIEREGKPKCLPQSKAHALGKQGRASAAARKRREDPNPERRGAAKNVATRREDVAERCWDGYRRAGTKLKGGREVPNCVPLDETACPHCGGPMVTDAVLAEKQDACYHKVRSRYKVWPSAYASGALVQCRKKGAANWGNKTK